MSLFMRAVCFDVEVLSNFPALTALYTPNVLDQIFMCLLLDLLGGGQ